MDISTILALEAPGQDWQHILGLVFAFVLSSLIGFERETKYKSAGLRTHALVGLSAALLVLVSKFGFVDVLGANHMGLDPSRVAAQIVSGIGFIGGGLIFVRKDIVHGLTTAATVWLTAAIGMACGAGLHILALISCIGYFVVVFGYTSFMDHLRGNASRLQVHYRVGHDAAASVIALCAAKDFSIVAFSIGAQSPDPDTAMVELRVRGRGSLEGLAQEMAHLPAIFSVTINPPEG